MAEEALSDREYAMYWLNTPNSVFGEETQITLIDTESDTEWVEQVLGRMMVRR